MFIFALLGALFAAAQLGIVSRAFRLDTQRDRAGWAMGVMFLFTGILHFARPAPFVAMVPPYLPFPEVLVVLSGVAELAVAVGLMTARHRRIAALAAVALLVAIFPANLHAAQSGAPIPDYPSAAWYRWLRVALQGLLVAWALAAARTSAYHRRTLMSYGIISANRSRRHLHRRNG